HRLHPMPWQFELAEHSLCCDRNGSGHHCRCGSEECSFQSRRHRTCSLRDCQSVWNNPSDVGRRSLVERSESSGAPWSWWTRRTGGINGILSELWCIGGWAFLPKMWSECSTRGAFGRSGLHPATLVAKQSGDGGEPGQRSLLYSNRRFDLSVDRAV